MILSEQTVENEAVARREETLEVHSSFFRKLRFDRDAAAEAFLLFADVSEYPCVAGARAGMMDCCNGVIRPNMKD